MLWLHTCGIISHARPILSVVGILKNLRLEGIEALKKPCMDSVNLKHVKQPVYDERWG